MSVRTRPMFAIPFAINLGSVAVILRQCGFASCNQRAHGPPMFAIPTPDVCRSLQGREASVVFFVESTDSACGPPEIGGPQNLRPARATADQAVAEGRVQRTGWKREAAHEWWQEEHTRHAAGRCRKSAACQHLHEPLSQALATQRLQQCRRLRHPQPSIGGLRLWRGQRR